MTRLVEWAYRDGSVEWTCPEGCHFDLSAERAGVAVTHTDTTTGDGRYCVICFKGEDN